MTSQYTGSILGIEPPPDDLDPYWVDVPDRHEDDDF